MLIISSDGNLVVNSQYVTKYESGDRVVIAYTATNCSNKGDAFIGKYDNKLQAGRALNMMLDALLRQEEVFYMPDIGDPALRVEDIMHGAGGFSERKGKTTGKTK